MDMDQKIMNRFAEDLIGQWNVAVEDGNEDYRTSYVAMAEQIYFEAINQKGVVWMGKEGKRISDGCRFQGKAHLRNMVLLAMSLCLMEWGVPMFHDGSDSIMDVMRWANTED